jgi:hypothetical protein
MNAFVEQPQATRTWRVKDYTIRMILRTAMPVTWTCDCRAGQCRRPCKHVDQVLGLFRAGLDGGSEALPFIVQEVPCPTTTSPT